MQTEESPHLEFSLLWVQAILISHGEWVRENRASIDAELRTVSRAVGRVRDELRRLADENCFTIDYLLSQPVVTNGVQNGGSNGQKTITNGTDTRGVEMEEDDDDAEWIGLD
jgi:periodic tryptophan protein 2